MTIVLLEDERAPIFSAPLRKRFPSSSIVYITSRNLKDYIKTLKSKPILSNKWLVFVDKRVGTNATEELASLENCITVFYVTNKTAKQILSLVKGVKEDVRFLDVLNMDKDECAKYITTRLPISIQNATILANRCNYYLPYIEESILTLNSLEPPIRKSDIEKYIAKHNSMNPTFLFYHIVGLRKANDREIADYLYAFRYAHSYIKKSLLDIFSDVEIIYGDMYKGELGADNISSYYTSKRLKVSEHLVKNVVLNIHKNVSVDALVLYKYTVQKTETILDLLSIL